MKYTFIAVFASLAFGIAAGWIIRGKQPAKIETKIVKGDIEVQTHETVREVAGPVRVETHTVVRRVPVRVEVPTPGPTRDVPGPERVVTRWIAETDTTRTETRGAIEKATETVAASSSTTSAITTVLARQPRWAVSGGLTLDLHGDRKWQLGGGLNLVGPVWLDAWVVPQNTSFGAGLRVIW